MARSRLYACVYRESAKASSQPNLVITLFIIFSMTYIQACGGYRGLSDIWQGHSGDMGATRVAWLLRCVFIRCPQKHMISRPKMCKKKLHIQLVIF